MKSIVTFILSCLITGVSFAATPNLTKRTPLLENDKVNVWQTTIKYGIRQQLAMHRHDHDRVVVALTDGKLKVVSNSGKTHELIFEKNHVYFLPKDAPGELHRDVNLSKHPVKVIVIELKS